MSLPAFLLEEHARAVSDVIASLGAGADPDLTGPELQMAISQLLRERMEVLAAARQLRGKPALVVGRLDPMILAPSDAEVLAAELYA